MTTLYLLAIVLANLSVAHFGPGAVYANAFLFIGLDLTARDRLHDRWNGHGLVWKMGLLIAAGGFLSWLLNRDAGTIALASTVAFATAAVVDAGVYHLLRRRAFIVRANASNVPAAAADSIVFPTLAFGGFDPIVTLGQFAAKVLGGLFWSLVLNRKRVAAKDDRTRGLYHKYDVKRADGSSEPGGKHADCFYFVLDLVHDSHALPALRAYAQSARADGYEELADDLEALARRER